MFLKTLIPSNKPLPFLIQHISYLPLLTLLDKNRRTLSRPQQKSYLSAVQCLLSSTKSPALTPPFPESGVLSRYDDLVYTHI